MQEIKITDYNTRDDLEGYVITTFGRTTDKKDAIIIGTKEELLSFKLNHGRSVWGVQVTSSDYKQKLRKEVVSRGEVLPSKVNGLLTNTRKNANNKNKDR